MADLLLIIASEMARVRLLSLGVVGLSLSVSALLLLLSVGSIAKTSRAERSDDEGARDRRPTTTGGDLTRCVGLSW